ncbi:hypothetical protein [Kordiimonas laminariae]|uniref:hypothetical protein n=1 Tax=Kordiimonas laminariae TaxID=2917717 RepID=UPI001FF5B113|nr:hypothetical protein [Kordiimonas laminariae]MCK0071154.1 hypothetical protein [Kordiimonas laminariae]
MSSIYTSKFLLTGATLLSTVVFSPTLLAQDKDALIRCSEITSGAARLACYDKYVATLKGGKKVVEARTPPKMASKSATAPAPTTQQTEKLIEAEVEKRVEARLKAKEAEQEKKTEKVRKDSFGKSPSKETPKIITATVKDLRKRYGRGVLFLLDNGQTWEQIDGPDIRSLKKGKKVTIKRSPFGAYTMTVEGKSRAYPVKRKK